VIIRDFDVVGISSLPSETDAILLVDSNAVLTPAVPRESLEPVTRWNRQLPQIANC
jgi:hypothetical protein